ncbi:sigma 54-interacting transcriptional regulator [Paraburkholderia madseniana]|jgi:DNA-binding NtrC family response regulator|uniref:sigma-54-dependent transcriptional regulator n=1 Tax=Paraburkholderia madseniana TaxID=2599607 RepID=UPI001F47ACBC|nr:sigma-54 dependent transcriptional regulator [Paraburkholderia madseniana]
MMEFDSHSLSSGSRIRTHAQDGPTFIGSSIAFRQLVRLIERVAPTDHTLLITGPTGSGKELVARSVHSLGLNCDKPFVDVNCGAIPEHLVEAELFGHVKGAFTGAAENHEGLLRQVGQGTLFLDEIGELPLTLQPKLLRALETRSFRPVGSSSSARFEGRVVAATHRDLRLAVREGRFREDLFYRLAVFVLTVPGLDQRIEDIPLLIDHFAAQQSRVIEFTPAAIRCLCLQAWPGHIRQLRNLVSQLSVLAERTQIDVDMLTPYLAADAVDTMSRGSLADQLLQLEGDDKLAAAENLLIDRALERTSNNKSAAAVLLGVSRKTIERRQKAREERHRAARGCLEQADALVGASQFRDAIPLLRRCLDLLLKSNGQDDTRHLQFEAYRMLGVSLRSVYGWLHAEATACYVAALSVGQGVCDEDELASVRFGVWTTQLTTLQLTEARATAQDLLQQAQGIGKQATLDEAHVAMVNTLFWLGDSEEALACLGRGGLTGIGRKDRRIGVQGLDLAGLALTFEGLAGFQIGAVDKARRAMEMLVARTSDGNEHALGHVLDLQGAAWLAFLFNEIDRLGELASELDAVSKAAGFTFYRGVGKVFQACYLSARASFDEAQTMLLDGYDNHMANNGGALFYSFKTWQHGELLLRAGRPDACELLLASALDEAIERQERVYLGELLIVRARAQWALGDMTEAEQGLRGAISTARALGSVPARIAASTYLADLLKQTGRRAEAVDVLERAVRAVSSERPAPGAMSAFHLLAELRNSDFLHPHQKGLAHGI